MTDKAKFEIEGLLEIVADEERTRMPAAAPVRIRDGEHPPSLLRMLLSARHHPDELRDWWADHGNSCRSCNFLLQQLYDEAPDVRGVVGPLLGKVAVSGARVLLLGGLHDSPSSLAYAAATDDLLAREHPLPRVSFHELPREKGSGVDSAYLVRLGDRLLLLLLGPDDGLDAWREGAVLSGESGERYEGFGPAPDVPEILLCPEGRFPGLARLFLEARDPTGRLFGGAFAAPGLIAGKIVLRPTAGESGIEDLVADMVARNRGLRFIEGLPRDRPPIEKALQIEFYIRLLVAQDRVDEQAAQDLTGLRWLPLDILERLEPGSAGPER